MDLRKMAFSLKSVVTFHQMALPRDFGKEAKVSEWHERGDILCWRCVGDKPQEGYSSGGKLDKGVP